MEPAGTLKLGCGRLPIADSSPIAGRRFLESSRLVVTCRMARMARLNLNLLFGFLASLFLTTGSLLPVSYESGGSLLLQDATALVLQINRKRSQFLHTYIQMNRKKAEPKSESGVNVNEVVVRADRGSAGVKKLDDDGQVRLNEVQEPNNPSKNVVTSVMAENHNVTLGKRDHNIIMEEATIQHKLDQQTVTRETGRFVQEVDTPENCLRNSRKLSTGSSSEEYSELLLRAAGVLRSSQTSSDWGRNVRYGNEERIEGKAGVALGNNLQNIGADLNNPNAEGRKVQKSNKRGVKKLESLQEEHGLLMTPASRPDVLQTQGSASALPTQESTNANPRSSRRSTVIATAGNKLLQLFKRPKNHRGSATKKQIKKESQPNVNDYHSSVSNHQNLHNIGNVSRENSYMYQGQQLQHRRATYGPREEQLCDEVAALNQSSNLLDQSTLNQSQLLLDRSSLLLQSGSNLAGDEESPLSPSPPTWAMESDSRQETKIAIQDSMRRLQLHDTKESDDIRGMGDDGNNNTRRAKPPGVVGKLFSIFRKGDANRTSGKATKQSKANNAVGTKTAKGGSHRPKNIDSKKYYPADSREEKWKSFAGAFKSGEMKIGDGSNVVEGRQSRSRRSHHEGVVGGQHKEQSTSIIGNVTKSQTNRSQRNEVEQRVQVVSHEIPEERKSLERNYLRGDTNVGRTETVDPSVLLRNDGPPTMLHNHNEDQPRQSHELCGSKKLKGKKLQKVGISAFMKGRSSQLLSKNRLDAADDHLMNPPPPGEFNVADNTGDLLIVNADDATNLLPTQLDNADVVTNDDSGTTIHRGNVTRSTAQWNDAAKWENDVGENDFQLPSSELILSGTQQAVHRGAQQKLKISEEEKSQQEMQKRQRRQKLRGLMTQVSAWKPIKNLEEVPADRQPLPTARQPSTKPCAQAAKGKPTKPELVNLRSLTKAPTRPAVEFAVHAKILGRSVAEKRSNREGRGAAKKDAKNDKKRRRSAVVMTRNKQQPPPRNTGKRSESPHFLVTEHDDGHIRRTFREMSMDSEDMEVYGRIPMRNPPGTGGTPGLRRNLLANDEGENLANDERDNSLLEPHLLGQHSFLHDNHSKKFKRARNMSPMLARNHSELLGGSELLGSGLLDSGVQLHKEHQHPTVPHTRRGSKERKGGGNGDSNLSDNRQRSRRDRSRRRYDRTRQRSANEDGGHSSCCGKSHRDSSYDTYRSLSANRRFHANLDKGERKKQQKLERENLKEFVNTQGVVERRKGRRQKMMKACFEDMLFKDSIIGLGADERKEKAAAEEVESKENCLAAENLLYKEVVVKKGKEGD